MDCYQKNIPNIVNKTQSELDELIERLRKSGLSQSDADFFVGCLECSIWLPNALQEKNISINNLRRVLFGDTNLKKKKKKKTDQETDQEKDKTSNNPDCDSDETIPENADKEVVGMEPDQSNQNSNVIDLKKSIEKKPGHGRMGYDVYANATHITAAHNTYQAGDYCPEKCGGKLYQLLPGHVTRVIGNPPMTVTVFEVEKFRCALCTTVFKAPLPYGITDEKYDYAVKAQIAIQKYFMGAPFYRQQDYYAMLETPVPDATQFELCEDVANCAYPVIGALEKIAANAELSYIDDTHAKILSVIADNKKNPDKERTGQHTTGIIANTLDEKTVALFYT